MSISGRLTCVVFVVVDGNQYSQIGDPQPHCAIPRDWLR